MRMAANTAAAAMKRQSQSPIRNRNNSLEFMKDDGNFDEERRKHLSDHTIIIKVGEESMERAVPPNQVRFRKASFELQLERSRDMAHKLEQQQGRGTNHVEQEEDGGHHGYGRYLIATFLFLVITCSAGFFLVDQKYSTTNPHHSRRLNTILTTEEDGDYSCSRNKFIGFCVLQTQCRWDPIISLCVSSATQMPTFSLTASPSQPTASPTKRFTRSPTRLKTTSPSVSPTFMPTLDPTKKPTVRKRVETSRPSLRPSSFPTEKQKRTVPTSMPTWTGTPTKFPSRFQPKTGKPTEQPSLPPPTPAPSVESTKHPTRTKSPSRNPTRTKSPSRNPTSTKVPTTTTTMPETTKQEEVSTGAPSSKPSLAPTIRKSVGLGYDIELSFVTQPTATTSGATITEQQSIDITAAFFKAKSRWEALITSDIQSLFEYKQGTQCFAQYQTTAKENRIVDDLLIFVNIVSIDGIGGILGSSGPCIITVSSSGKKYARVGLMKFDQADLVSLLYAKTLEAVILHEMAHVIGFGTLWPSLSLKSGNNYVGAGGIEGLKDVGGSGYPQIERTGGAGTSGGHWDQQMYAPELMTGWLSNNPKLSKLTLKAMVDLGFTVNEEEADFAYSLPKASLKQNLNEKSSVVLNTEEEHSELVFNGDDSKKVYFGHPEEEEEEHQHDPDPKKKKNNVGLRGGEEEDTEQNLEDTSSNSNDDQHEASSAADERTVHFGDDIFHVDPQVMEEIPYVNGKPVL